MSIIESILIIFVFIVGASIIWGTLKVGISPMPSSKKARQAILELSKVTGNGPIYDLGSGWGHLVISLARLYPERQIVAYELSMVPWLVTKLLKKLLGLNNLVLYRKNFLTEDLSHASVLICYLFPVVMDEIKEKLQLDTGNTRFVISNNFALPTYKAEQVIRLNDFYKSPVYLYKMKGLEVEA